ncbi:MAG: sugar phosphate isomerase/epimerase, partial [Verrucomicrobia bacterium]|nr:sugar phosphate isomerase/epimerase [Verrucomicrobiota bacterium]
MGLELYSVRDELARDLPGTLKAVASFGYEVVEFY